MDVDSSSSLDWRFGFSLSRPLSTCSTRSCHMKPFVSFRDITTGLLNLVGARVLLLLLHDHLENGWWWRCYRLKDDNDPVSGDYWIFIIHFYPTTDTLHWDRDIGIIWSCSPSPRSSLWISCGSLWCTTQLMLRCQMCVYKSISRIRVPEILVI